jgi:hypothetical protein
VNQYSPGAAALVALIVGILYAEGGVYRIYASLIILAILITPVSTGVGTEKKSLLLALLETLDGILATSLESAGTLPAIVP